MAVVLLDIKATDGATAPLLAINNLLMRIDGSIGLVTRSFAKLDGIPTSSIVKSIGNIADAMTMLELSIDRVGPKVKDLVLTFRSGMQDMVVQSKTSVDAINAQSAALDALKANIATMRGMAPIVIKTTTSSTGGGTGSSLTKNASTAAANDLGYIAGVPSKAMRAGGVLAKSVGTAAIPLVAAGYAGYKLSDTAAAYQSNIKQTLYQSSPMGTSQKQLDSDYNTLYSGILDYTGSGKSPFKADVLSGQNGIEPVVAAFGAKKAIEGLPAIAQLAAQNKASDIKDASQAVINFSTLTGKSLTASAGVVSQAETMTPLAPGDLTKALPTLLTANVGTGATTNEALGSFIAYNRLNPRARLDATSYRAVISNLESPQNGAKKLAADAGIDLGAGGTLDQQGLLKTFQDVYNVQQQMNATKAHSGDAFVSKIFTQKNSLAYYKGLTANNGAGLLASAQNVDKLNGSPNSPSGAYAGISQGIQQQETQVVNQLNTAFINLGTAINQTVMPAFLDIASAFAVGLTALTKNPTKVVEGGLNTLKEWASHPGESLAQAQGQAYKDMYQVDSNGKPVLDKSGNPVANQNQGWNDAWGQWIDAHGGVTGSQTSFDQIGNSIGGSIYDYLHPANKSNPSTSVPTIAGIPNVTGIKNRSTGEVTPVTDIPGVTGVPLGSINTSGKPLNPAGITPLQYGPPVPSKNTFIGPQLPGINQQNFDAPSRNIQHITQQTLASMLKSSAEAPKDIASAVRQLSEKLALQDHVSKAEKDLNASQSATDKAAQRAANLANVQPFKEKNAGLGGLEAAFGSTAVRFGGGQDPQAEEIRKLQQELANANNTIINLLSQVAHNTSTQKNTVSTNPVTVVGGNRNYKGR